MTFWNESTPTYRGVDVGSAVQGRKVGFLDSFETGYEEQVRASATYGIENELSNLEGEQLRKLRDAGIQDPPTISSFEHSDFGQFAPAGLLSDEYINLARYYSEGSSPEVAEALRAYDERIRQLRKELPELDLRTSDEMYQTVRDEAREYDRRAQTERRTIGGYVGEFAGATVGSMSPTSDPFNFVTTPIGGVGKSIGMRIIGQAGMQGVIESINQVTGVQEERRLLGLSHGPLDAAMRVGGAAVFGAALQSAGEGIAAAGRRWFRNTPSDPAPAPVSRTEPPAPAEPTVAPRTTVPSDVDLVQSPQRYVDLLVERSPMGADRRARQRTALDLDAVTRQLDTWDGPAPANTDPLASVAALPEAGQGAVSRAVAAALDRAGIAERARKVDPNTMRRYDELTITKRALQNNLDVHRTAEIDAARAALEIQQRKVDDLVAKAEASTGRRAARVRKQIEAERQVARDLANVEERLYDTPAIRNNRRQIQETDEALRDIAPLVSRAMNIARRKWNAGEKQRAADERIVREALGIRDEAPAERGGLASFDEVFPVRPSEPGSLASQLAKAADEAGEALTEGVEVLRAALPRVLDGEDTKYVLPDGKEIDLDSDRIIVPGDDGEEISLTPRQLLERSREDEYEMEAVSVCSVQKTS